MATMTLSMPDAMKEWIEAETAKGDYASTSDFMRDLVRRERERREPRMTLEELQQRLAEASASGPGDRTIEEIIAEGDRILKQRGTYRD
ncbi:ribbon-helix-helix domain-containing protein [Chenggangzhangella methanolivorans]|uniref:Type II toxin-antitoxin system ParD family antitoxin n=1 Tax=Chenggangzhangella methanolivorans TaxID=1437009 RepID=A0A9E6R7M7_9HYPH|nr:type II toxin-antitoxin system ParD family antitoxin [Chenggangzhangella methanolivorans]QZN99710.1 type II toxin-antitoxin system ParD family antitoxin [Chenggangzhangella methanolivorans]